MNNAQLLMYRPLSEIGELSDAELKVIVGGSAYGVETGTNDSGSHPPYPPSWGPNGTAIRGSMGGTSIDPIPAMTTGVKAGLAYVAAASPHPVVRGLAAAAFVVLF